MAIHEWVAAARDDAATQQFLNDHVYGPADQAAYLDSTGGADRLISVIGWEK